MFKIILALLFSVTAAQAGSYTTYLNLYKPATGDTNYVTPFANGMTTIDTLLGTAPTTYINTVGDVMTGPLQVSSLTVTGNMGVKGTSIILYSTPTIYGTINFNPVNNNVCVGNNSCAASTMTTTFLNAFGDQALMSNTTGQENSAFGAVALKRNTVGEMNCAFGNDALTYNTFGNSNSAFGNFSLLSNESGHYNTAIGNQSLAQSRGHRNTGVGYYSLLYTTGTASDNTSVGYSAGSINTTGEKNVFIGANANPSTSGLSNAVAIGYGSNVTCSNCLALGPDITSGLAYYVGIGTGTPTQRLEIMDGMAYVNRPNAGRDVDNLAFYSTISTDTILGPISIYLGAYPSTIDANRYAYLQISGNTNYIPLALQPSGGFVGISTKAPQAMLDVNGSEIVRGNSLITGALQASSATLTGNAGQYGLTVSSNISLGGILYTNLGRVGVNNSNPSSLLHVSTEAVGSTPQIYMYNSDNTNSASNSKLQIKVGGASAGDPFVQLNTGANSWYMAVDNSNNDLFSIGLEQPSATFAIKTSGFVGIGTTNPDTKLHISSSTITLDGAGAPSQSYSLCLSTGGAMGHCTSAVNASGGCNCITP